MLSVNPDDRNADVFSCASWEAAVPGQAIPDRERKGKGDCRRKCPLLQLYHLTMISVPYGRLKWAVAPTKNLLWHSENTRCTAHSTV